jgi:hypothetical protein
VEGDILLERSLITNSLQVKFGKYNDVSSLANRGEMFCIYPRRSCAVYRHEEGAGFLFSLRMYNNSHNKPFRLIF